MKIKWKYTIGEILIVIIGVTIAFTLNNCKENRQKKTERNLYINNLIIDVEQELIQLHDNQNQVSGKLEQIQKIRPFLGSKSNGRDSIAYAVFGLSRLIAFHPENTTYQTLINSGDLKLISNFTLRRSIEEHYAMHDNILNDYKRLEKINEKYMGDFYIYEIDFKAVSKGDLEFLDNPLLLNIISSIEQSYRLLKNSNKKCIQSNEDLLAILKAKI